MSQPVCAIIGAGEGLGRALAAKFAGQGFDITLLSRTEQGSAASLAAAVDRLLASSGRPVESSCILCRNP